jgi:hypothetical protein
MLSTAPSGRKYLTSPLLDNVPAYQPIEMELFDAYLSSG